MAETGQHTTLVSGQHLELRFELDDSVPREGSFELCTDALDRVEGELDGDTVIVQLTAEHTETLTRTVRYQLWQEDTEGRRAPVASGSIAVRPAISCD